MSLRVKRIYDDPAPGDGARYLVDRLWPRGVAKDRARLAGWLKELAPSDALRRWFGHDPARWGEFKRRYKLELTAKAKRRIVDRLAAEAAQGPVTLVYAAKDEQHNNAQALREKVEGRMEKKP